MSCHQMFRWLLEMILFFNIYWFIWPYQVLVTAHRIFVTAQGSLAVGHGLWRAQAQELWQAGSLIAVHGLQSSLASGVAAHGFSCSMACGIIFPCPGIDITSPALPGRFLTTGQSGEHHWRWLCVHFFFLCLWKNTYIFFIV